MKILSIEEALGKGLLRKTTKGLAISDITNIIKSDPEKELLESVFSPSVIVSDDEKRVLCTTVKKQAKDFNDGITRKKEYTMPRVYTLDNLPTLVEGVSYNGEFPDYITIVQDNENIDIVDYNLCIKSAKGYLDKKAKLNKENNCIEEVINLEEPIKISFEDNVLEVTANNVNLENNDKFCEILPVINRETFLDYKYYIELDDGRKSELTYGYTDKPHVEKFCMEVIEKVEKLQIIGNINEKDIECGEYNETIEEAATYYEIKPKEIEILEEEDKELKDLIKLDLELDKQIYDKECLLTQKMKESKQIQSTKEENERGEI